MSSVPVFRDAAEDWLKAAQTRKRRPMRSTSVPSVRCAFDKWLFPHLGDLPLDKVHNGSVKKMVHAMTDDLAPKSINTYVNLVKVVVASVVNEETGEPIYMRKWSSTVMDLPVVENQKQPVLDADEVITLASTQEPWLRMLYVLLASTGLRISEALALTQAHIENSWRTLSVGQQVSRFGKIVPYTKTQAGGTELRPRHVDLHPSVSDLLQNYCQRHRKFGAKGLLFHTRANTPHLPRNLLRVMPSKKGFHAFRRFRETVLSEMNCNHDVKIYWMGHKPESMSELYSKLAQKIDMRLKEAERVGIGFDLDQIVKD